MRRSRKRPLRTRKKSSTIVLCRRTNAPPRLKTATERKLNFRKPEILRSHLSAEKPSTGRICRMPHRKSTHPLTMYPQMRNMHTVYTKKCQNPSNVCCQAQGLSLTPSATASSIPVRPFSAVIVVFLRISLYNDKK